MVFYFIFFFKSFIARAIVGFQINLSTYKSNSQNKKLYIKKKHMFFFKLKKKNLILFVQKCPYTLIFK